jgi:uncharacterized membrane protein
MKKTWMLAIVVLLVFGLFLAGALFLPIPLGVPSVRVNLKPANQPWPIMPGGTLQLGITIVNDAWLFAAAKNVRAVIVAPEKFTAGSAGTNEYTVHMDILRGGEEQTSAFNLTAPYIISSGIYNMTVKVSADNVREQLLTAQINVTQHTYIP